MKSLNLNLGNLTTTICEAQAIIHDAAFVVAVTGAGISLASGLPLVDSKVEGVHLRDFFRHRLLDTQPRRFYEVYRKVLSEWRCATPNAAHQTLAQHGVWVVTQNIDGLHRDAGSKHVIEMHGNLRELRCPECKHIFSSQLVMLQEIPTCPRCSLTLCPGISFEGDEIRHYSRVVDWIGRADALLVVGTSLDMHPVRDIPKIAETSGASVIWVNESAETILPKVFTKTRGV